MHPTQQLGFLSLFTRNCLVNDNRVTTSAKSSKLLLQCLLWLIGRPGGCSSLSLNVPHAGWVVGSLELLFNPTGIVRSFSVGLSDLLYMPYYGLQRGPGAFVTGVSQGIISAASNVTRGLLLLARLRVAACTVVGGSGGGCY